MSYIQRNCDCCSKEYKADTRNLKRGWGLCCSKSCAAKKREMSRPGYNPERVKKNNIRRILWNDNYVKNSNGVDDIGNWDPGDSMYWDAKDFN